MDIGKVIKNIDAAGLVKDVMNDTNKYCEDPDNKANIEKAYFSKNTNGAKGFFKKLLLREVEQVKFLAALTPSVAKHASIAIIKAAGK